MTIPEPEFNLGDVVKYVGGGDPLFEKNYRIIARGYGVNHWQYLIDYCPGSSCYSGEVWLNTYHKNISCLPEVKGAGEIFWSTDAEFLRLVERCGINSFEGAGLNCL